MTKLYLRCKDRRFPKGEWLLHLSEEGGRLVDADEAQQAAFSHAEAERRFVFPSFWQSVKDLGVVTDRGDTVWFDPLPDHLEDIHDYLSSALAYQGPAAIQTVRRKAWLQVGGGVALMVFAVGASVVTMIRAFSNPAGGTYIVAIGILALGGTLFARGLTALRRAQKATEEVERGDRT